jgi:hypothetical protein
MPEADVDIEGLGDQQSVKKLEFDSGWALSFYFMLLSM